jgi:single-stranded-DNA-specific exonuclease
MSEEQKHALRAYLLNARGIESEEAQQRFLEPDWERDTHDPFLMHDMDVAVQRIVEAVQQGEHILIWSDYDMDGIPGAVVLYDCFVKLGYTHVSHHTPHRNIDGFGLNKQGIDEAKENGVHLLITIDCGIADVAMVAYAKEKGIDVIVTDHHLTGDVLPPALAVVDPKREDCAYPEPMLCGAGVIFKVVQGLLSYLRTHPEAVPEGCCVPQAGWEKWLLDMVGIATIADMVPLVGENRVFARYGLLVLRKSPRAGLQALLKKARAADMQQWLTEEDVGFTIAPRVNAASRMGHAKSAFLLLSASDSATAGMYAEELEKVNAERKTAVGVMKRELHARLKEREHIPEVIVMGNPEWQPSLLGLVAGGVAEEYSKPVFLWGRGSGEVIKGSCRGAGGVSVHALMAAAGNDAFIEYGGHREAGGFSLSDRQVHTLETALLAAHATLGEVEDALVFETVAATLADVSHDTMRFLEQLAPFGVGNPRPVFRFEGVVVAQVRQFGKGNEHLEITVCSRCPYSEYGHSEYGHNGHVGKKVKAIAFFTTPEKYTTPVQIGAQVTVLAHMEINRFRGSNEVRLRLVGVEAGGECSHQK